MYQNKSNEIHFGKEIEWSTLDSLNYMSFFAIIPESDGTKPR